MPVTLAEVLERIKNPENWVDRDAMVGLIRDNPSFRSFASGYTAEYHFLAYLHARGIHESYKTDDHDRKSKADRTFIHAGRRFTVQLKSFQTNTIREIEPGAFTATVQNDASDSREVLLPNGERLKTTCYVVGEYDILAVGLYGFTGEWNFAFKKNKELRHSTHRPYTAVQREYLLASSEPFAHPIPAQKSGWTTDLFALLSDPDLGEAHVVAESSNTETVVVQPPGTDATVVIQEPRPK